jgi:hypothetical protein
MAALCLMADLQRPLECRIVIVTLEDVDRRRLSSPAFS